MQFLMFDGCANSRQGRVNILTLRVQNHYSVIHQRSADNHNEAWPLDKLLFVFIRALANPKPHAQQLITNKSRADDARTETHTEKADCSLC